MIGKGVSIWVLALCSSLIAETLNFEAFVDRQTVHMNGFVSYQIRISGADMGQTPALVLPDFKGKFHIVSTSKSHSFSIVNGAMSSSEIRKYRLAPVAVGSFTIGSAQFKYQGKTYRSNEIEIKVLPEQQVSANSSVASSPQPSQTGESSIFAQSSLDREHVYVGEEVRYQLNLFRRIRLFSEIVYEVPDMTGFWREALSKKDQEYAVRIKGRNYYVHELSRLALFPLQPGVLEIPPAKVGFSINIFEGQRVVQTRPLTLEVKPLPIEGKPDTFSGFVGELSLSGSGGRRSFTLNQPVSLKMILSGKGNLRQISALAFQETEALKIYQSKVEDQLELSQGVSGRREFEYIVVPKMTGDVLIPTFSVSYFSPENDRYQRVEIPAQRMLVIGDSAPVETGVDKQTGITKVDDDIKYLKTPLSVHRVYQAYWRNLGLLGILALDILALILLVGFVIKRRFFKLDLRGQRRQKALKVAQSALKQDEIRIEQTVIQFLSDQTGQVLAGRPREDVQVILSRLGVSVSMINRLFSLLDQDSYSAYSGAGSRDQSALREDVAQILAELEGVLS